MRVTSGLDSLILGKQILGQVKNAFLQSKRYHQLSIELDQWFQRLFAFAKYIREIQLSTHDVLVVLLACKLASHIFESLAKLNILLVGAGETIELAALHLREQHCAQKLIIANRTCEHA